MSKFWSRTFDKVSENEVYEKAFEKHFCDDFSWYSVSKGKYNPLC
jgi:hypothetical protein